MKIWGSEVDIEWPALFASADRVSLDGQRLQKRCFGGIILLNITAAGLANFANHKPIALTMLVVMITAVGFSIALLTIRPQAEWYNGRALAESVKTLSWRFVTCTVPYTKERAEQDAKEAFTEALKTALKEGNSISSGLFTQSGDSTQITNSMLDVRRLPLCERRDLYLTERLRDQQKWYSEAAKKNRRAELIWGSGAVFCECLALLFAALAIATVGGATAGIGIITTAASGVAAWQQQCQFGALASAYGMTAQELSTIQSLSGECQSEDALSNFVLSAERAISREHTYWLARRRNP